MTDMLPINRGDIFDDCKVVAETDACYILGRTPHDRTYYDIIMIKDVVGEFTVTTTFKAKVEYILIAHDGVPGAVVVPCE